ncbi:MAG: hypothetical protein RLZZ292_3167, partial [Bacteroidota bacterium]
MLVQLQFPTIVRRVEKNYIVQPLFIQKPSVANARYEMALSGLKDFIRKMYFQRLNIPQLNTLLPWFLFSPKLDFQRVPMDMVVAQTVAKGFLPVVLFRLQDIQFLFLPSFESEFLIVDEKEVLDNDFYKRMFKRLFLAVKEDNDEAEIKDYLWDGKEFLSTLEVEINAPSPTFKLAAAKNEFSWFSSLFSESKFNGADELRKVADNLNEAYPSELKRAFYREEIVTRLGALLYPTHNPKQETRNSKQETVNSKLQTRNPTSFAIVGPVGVGKHTLLQEAIYRKITEFRTHNVDNQYLTQLWHLDPNRVIAGMSVVGYWQKRFEAILKYLQQPNPDRAGDRDKLLIDNIVALSRIGKSAQNSLTLSDVLKKYIEKQAIHTILIATPEEWKILQEENKSFADLFQVIRIAPTDILTSYKIALEQRKILEREKGTKFTLESLGLIFDLQRNFMRDKALPGAVLNYMTQLSSRYNEAVVDKNEVRETFSQRSGLSQSFFLESSAQYQPDEWKEYMESRLLGQTEAVNALSDVTHLIVSKLKDPNRPIATMLFIGPTGVGKTQGAKVLTELFYNGDQSKLLRFDMNEFIDSQAISRLIGDTHHPEGLLTGKVRYQPYSIILLDEIEKANRAVHDLLLQLLDDGRLTDSLGRTVDFTNTLILMTSNVGANEIGSQVTLGNNTAQDKLIYERALSRTFRPEFLNRIDKTVYFQPLTLQDIMHIADLQIQELLSRDGLVRRTTIVNVEHAALRWVAERGFDSKMGGRALKRQIEKDLTALLAYQLNRIQSTQPIILDIFLKDNQLVPQVTEL